MLTGLQDSCSSQDYIAFIDLIIIFREEATSALAGVHASALS